MYFAGLVLWARDCCDCNKAKSRFRQIYYTYLYMYVYYKYVVKSTLNGKWLTCVFQPSAKYTIHSIMIMCWRKCSPSEEQFMPCMNIKQETSQMCSFTFLFIISSSEEWLEKHLRCMYLNFAFQWMFLLCCYVFEQRQYSNEWKPTATTWKSFSHLLVFMKMSKSIVTICLFYLWLNFYIENSIERV